MMGDLLKNMRSSQIFSVCGLPDVDGPQRQAGRRRTARSASRWSCSASTRSIRRRWRPTIGRGTTCRAGCSTRTTTASASDASQAFFPRTSAWDDLKKALKADYDETVWDHLAGTTQRAVRGRRTAQIAVKVIDDRGNELLVVKPLPA